MMNNELPTVGILTINADRLVANVRKGNTVSMHLIERVTDATDLLILYPGIRLKASPVLNVPEQFTRNAAVIELASYLRG